MSVTTCQLNFVLHFPTSSSFQYLIMRYFVVVASTLAVASAAVGLSNIQHDPEVVQGVIDTLYKIYGKLVELGKSLVLNNIESWIKPEFKSNWITFVTH